MEQPYKKELRDKAYEALEMKLKVKKEYCGRLTKNLADYLENKGPIKTDGAAGAALEVRSELIEEIEDIEKLLAERED